MGGFRNNRISKDIKWISFLKKGFQRSDIFWIRSLTITVTKRLKVEFLSIYIVLYHFTTLKFLIREEIEDTPLLSKT